MIIMVNYVQHYVIEKCSMPSYQDTSGERERERERCGRRKYKKLKVSVVSLLL